MSGNSDATPKNVPDVWCVRADGGRYAEHFISGGYVAVGYENIKRDLSFLTSKEELYSIMIEAYPEITSSMVIGNYVGQLGRFVLEIKPGDYVITPAADTEWLYYGVVEGNPSYYYAQEDDGCPYRHRRRVKWAEKRLRRTTFSVPFQNMIRSMLTVFAISRTDEFFRIIELPELMEDRKVHQYDPYKVVLDKILELDCREFEYLVGYLLAALGFEGTEVVGKPGDGGVDAIGELNVANLAKIKLFVQAKRYKLGSKVSASTVKQLRASIPAGGQGAFITTADFQEAAADIASEPGFPRIGLINGTQLVDLLIEHWNDIPEEFREQLGLKPGLVVA